MKQGEEWKVLAEDREQRLDKWLAAPARLGSRSKALQAIGRGQVFVKDVEQGTSDSSRKVVASERVRVWHDRPGGVTNRYFERHDSGLRIIYEDQTLIVINKPAGLLTVPLASLPGEPSLFDQVQNYLRSARKVTLLVVHRIDRDTSGLVVFAKSPAAMTSLKDQFERRRPKRVYLAYVCRVLPVESGSWHDMLVWDQDELRQKPASTDKPDRIGVAKPATLHWRGEERFERASLLEFRLVSEA